MQLLVHLQSHLLQIVMLSSNVSNLISTICESFSVGASFEVIFQNDKKERNSLNLILITDLPFYPINFTIFMPMAVFVDMLLKYLSIL